MTQALEYAAPNELKSSWHRFDEQTGKIQALLLGRAIMNNDGVLRKRLIRKLGAEFAQKDEDLICLGSQFLDFVEGARTGKCEAIAALVSSMQAALDRMEGNDRQALSRGQSKVKYSVPTAIQQLNLVPPNAWHQFYRSILQSEMSGGWFWRSIMNDAFERLASGEQPELFRATVSGRHGRPLELEHYRRLAVLHVYFEAGKGTGVDASRRKVAGALGAEFETLKTWSDSLRKKSRGKNDIDCARLAGRIGREFEHRAVNEFENIEQYGSYNGIQNLAVAEDIYWELLENSIEFVRSMLTRSKRKTER